MKIVDVQVIAFSVPTRGVRTKWGYVTDIDRQGTGVQRITRIVTDSGAEGYSAGGAHSYFYGATAAEVEQIVKPLLVGENPLDRERLWQWMTMNRSGFSEALVGNIDCALWDLLGRMAGVPVAKLLGGYRERVKAYASSGPNLGPAEVYVQQALECKARGYRAYKIHAYIYWDPLRNEPAPGMPAFPREDIKVCEAVREAVGGDMVLMLDPWGVYSYEQSLWVGRELERLGFYWLEHPMDERRIEPYRRLCSELDIAVCGPELATGSHYSRAEWALQKASDIGRIDVNFGGITACKKAVDMYESLGIPCEIHVGGFGNAQILGATSEETCEFFERGLHWTGEDYDVTPPYLKSPCDPMDSEGYVHLPQGPGLGMDFDWDYINAHRVNA
ncbi:MAG: enolase [SAR202 cluster bacterium]|nr:enolase [SAR202 cluster bacterium]